MSIDDARVTACLVSLYFFLLFHGTDRREKMASHGNGEHSTTPAYVFQSFDQHLVLIVSLSAILGSVGAQIVFRQFSASGYARKIDIALVILLAWAMWTVLYFIGVRAMASKPAPARVWFMRIVTNFTYVFSTFFYIYTNDFVQHTTLMYGMSPAEAIVYVVGGIVVISSIQTMFQSLAIFHIVDMQYQSPAKIKV